jgi:hypothetical protein
LGVRQAVCEQAEKQTERQRAMGAFCASRRSDEVASHDGISLLGWRLQRHRDIIGKYGKYFPQNVIFLTFGDGRDGYFSPGELRH